MWARRFHPGPLLAKVKKSTGITGLRVEPQAREKLLGLYQRTLLAAESIPEEAFYKQAVLKITNARLKVCQEEEDWEKIEERIGCGQVEELIKQAEDELKLIPKMIEWKPWEVPEGHKIRIRDEGYERSKHLPTHRSSWDAVELEISDRREREKKEKEAREKEAEEKEGQIDASGSSK
ncbi:probable NADH dehydrogenase [ubiquinone] 1 alpha subcomplex subunit 5, mitochondrial [Selaginella moellendorffii]|uniref:probable NADH dehydrogenase [ubiquinone] 1 alpha subcomplex subunit 5, mitochondrial n=1 Tax=Selaginella moellendorffii TaxID=88036 RepID=UPI000D1CEBFF|nr:probable NADH dehydrogenase [ubiquinone] 1 alpha subcomplex subunit 5, mitochondrial [Selaginella moellendorffii]|eukprot:XP_002968393.2 probable NADH dehydrogenase [ubiquinone] 1 alpha subcomplex subunit 5, mitochondrial [Selaginella moellendorffii]